jgi:hypothetical protein
VGGAAKKKSSNNYFNQHRTSTMPSQQTTPANTPHGSPALSEADNHLLQPPPRSARGPSSGPANATARRLSPNVGGCGDRVQPTEGFSKLRRDRDELAKQVDELKRENASCRRYSVTCKKQEKEWKEDREKLKAEKTELLIDADALRVEVEV